MNSFFAMMSRMKYIDRWALMRNSRQENLSEHSLEVSMIAHALAVIGNTCLEKNWMLRKRRYSACTTMPPRSLQVICLHR